ncbi:MAG: ribosome silencing factor [Prevotella sp.]|nr:ribosome silencing factor [Prevotella sp.]MBQ6209009.1 ribosome silencing factor [Prevotella sp.]
MEETRELVEVITKGIQEKKGQDIVIIDLSGIEGTIANYFVICQGNSPTQVEAITESVGDFAREKLDEKPTHVIGLGLSQWVAMDYGSVLVHIFVPGLRSYYDLESLWQDAKQTQIPNLD